MGKWKFAGAGLVLLAAGACSSDGAGDTTFLCPNVVVLAEASSIILQGSGTGASYTAHIAEATRECRLEGGTIFLDIKLWIKGERSDDTTMAELTLPYFVTSTERDRRVIQKLRYDRLLVFVKGASHAAGSESIANIQIPIEQGKDSWNYEIVVGFQLTREQLEYNRARMAR